jgi:hypothetical protein
VATGGPRSWPHVYQVIRSTNKRLIMLNDYDAIGTVTQRPGDFD